MSCSAVSSAFGSRGSWPRNERAGTGAASAVARTMIVRGFTGHSGDEVGSLSGRYLIEMLARGQRAG